MSANQSGASIHSQLVGMLSEPQRPTEPQPEPTGQSKAEEPAQSTQEPPETPQSDTESQSRIVKATLGDREIELQVLTDDVDLDLIPKGLMMEADYRKKTSEVSVDRKSIEQERADLRAQFQDVEDMLFAEAKDLESKEMLELKQDDPEEYWRKYNALTDKANRLSKHKSKMYEDLNKQQEELIKAEKSKHSEVIPEWLDAAVKKSDMAKIDKSLKEVGLDIKADDVYDHKLITLFRKAALYDEIKNAPIENKRVKNPPLSQSPGSAEKAPERSAHQKNMERLAKSGKKKDAQAAIKSLLGG